MGETVSSCQTTIHEKSHNLHDQDTIRAQMMRGMRVQTPSTTARAMTKRVQTADKVPRGQGPSSLGTDGLAPTPSIVRVSQARQALWVHFLERIMRVTVDIRGTLSTV